MDTVWIVFRYTSEDYLYDYPKWHIDSIYLSEEDAKYKAKTIEIQENVITNIEKWEVK